MKSPSKTNSKVPSSRRRRVLFRLSAIAISLLPLLACEGLFILLGWGRPGEIEDPYVGFDETRPLFVRRGERYEIPESRQEFFRPASFAAAKPANTFRIFCLGGSTVQGRPYATETSFTSWLELNLRAADDSRDWEVVNCGGVSYASYRLVPILRELLAHEPDLFVIYTGHSEFLEDRTYQAVKETPALVSRAHNLLSNVRTYCLLRSTLVREPAPNAAQTMLAAEVDALLDYRGGLEQYHRDDDWRGGVIEHFEFNLRRMIQMAGDADVPVLLVDPVSNLKDSPPFKFENRDDIEEEQLRQFTELWDRAKENAGDDLTMQCSLLEEARAIDDRHAGLHFHLGKTYEALGRLEEARMSFIRAKDEDICPLRIIEPMHDVISRVAADTGTPLVEVRAKFAAQTPGGIPGDEVLVDHVHPTIEGHQLIADWLLEALAEHGHLNPATDWRERREPLFLAHLDALDQVYYERGKQRLVGLQRWAAGRAVKIRPAEKRKN